MNIISIMLIYVSSTLITGATFIVYMALGY